MWFIIFFIAFCPSILNIYGRLVRLVRLVRCTVSTLLYKVQRWTRCAGAWFLAFRILLMPVSTHRLAFSSSSCNHCSLRRSNDQHRQRSLSQLSRLVPSPSTAQHDCGWIKFRENPNNFLFGPSELGRTNVGCKSIRMSACELRKLRLVNSVGNLLSNNDKTLNSHNRR